MSDVMNVGVGGGGLGKREEGGRQEIGKLRA